MAVAVGGFILWGGRTGCYIFEARYVTRRFELFMT